MSTHVIRGQNLNVLLQRFPLRRGLAFGVIIVSALLAFEMFNYSTTVFALSDLLGNLKFAGLPWATILAIAFCGIDFAGIARLFTPEEGLNEPTEVWYLFGAWLLAATMNAMLTWWGVSIAILNHQTLGNAVVERETLLRVVPIFVAIMVWLIRVLIIGTFSVAGERLFSQAENRAGYASTVRSIRPANSRVAPLPAQARPYTPSASAYMHAPKAIPQQPENTYARPEPTYHPVSMNARPGNSGENGGSQRSIPTIRR
jgi:hypothetical protein